MHRSFFMKKAVSTFALISLVVLSAACRDRSPETAITPVQNATDSAAHPASAGGTAVVPDVGSGTTVLVVVMEGSVAVKGQAVPPGPAVLTVENGGKEVHNLFIEGEGISRAAGDTIAPGATQSVDVILKPGTYTLYCPVLNHRELGEQTTITVGTSVDTSASTATSGS